MRDGPHREASPHGIDADAGEVTPFDPVPFTADGRLRNRLLVAAGVLLAVLVVVVADGRDDGSAVRSDGSAPTSVAGRASIADRPATGTADDPRGAGRRPSATEDAPPTGTASASVDGPAPTSDAAAPATSTTTPVPGPPAGLAGPVGARPVPPSQPVAPPSPEVVPAWPSTRTAAGYVATDVGCTSSTSARSLDAFFRSRLGPVIGHDYQHVYDLGGDRRLWLFHDTFLDPYGIAMSLDQASFAHNTAMLQDGPCFTLLTRGTAVAPTSFEPGYGERTLTRWFWPLGGEVAGGRLRVFWVEMVKTPDPTTPDGLGWIPAGTWLATYDAASLARLSFQPAPDSGVAPIYGYAVESDAEHTYLFGNSFDQNLAHQGGYHACPCSATAMYLARVPLGRLDAAPEYRASTGWSSDAGAAVAIVDRFHAENPMQPRFLGGQWVAATKVDGYWGDDLAIDVANQPWGPWTTVARDALVPRGGDPAMNTYHAYLMPWLSDGRLVVSASQNARDMRRDAWPHPERYRLQFLAAPLVTPPADPEPVETTVVTEPEVPPPTDPPATTAPPTIASTATTAAPTSTVTESTAATSTTAPDCTTTTTDAVTSTSSTTAPPTDPCPAP